MPRQLSNADFAIARFEHGHSFQEAIASQLRLAPYFLASLALHALIGLFFAGYELLQPEPAPAVVLEVSAPLPPPPAEPLPEPEPVPQQPSETQEPVLTESDAPVDDNDTPMEDIGDPLQHDNDSPFESPDDGSKILGIGGPPGGDHGLRGDRGHTRGGTPMENAVRDSLQWLADHQAPEGYWDCDQFFLYDRLADAPPSDGPGSGVNDVGVTGLALLAFLGAGNTTVTGEYHDTLVRGIGWLRSAQLDNGLFGEEVGNPTLYNHALATMAMGEAYLFSRSPILRPHLQSAVRLIVNARNPYLGWRYRLEPDGDNDTSLTAWMVFALETARDAGLDVGQDCFDGAEAWFRQMTDAGTGRTGYTLEAGPGSRPSRTAIYASRFPAEKSESLTAAALLCRMFTAPRELRSWKEHPDYESLRKQAELLSRTPPRWDEAGGSIDLYYWYYATFALYQWGGKAWEDWRVAMEPALLQHQRKDGNFKGSWDPQVDAWGREGGRVYTTALGAVILEVYYRYARLTGAR